MTKTEYAEYTRSEHWQQRRKQAIADARNECERCTLPRWVARLIYDQDLHVHHRNYQNLGNEQRDDLECLCRRCHEIETFGRSDYREPKTAECTVCGVRHWDIHSDYCHPCRTIIDNKSSDYIYLRLHRQYDNVPLWQWLLHHIASFAYTEQIGSRDLMVAIFSGVKAAATEMKIPSGV